MAGYSREFPALANLIALRRHVFELGDTLTAPYNALELRFKSQDRKISHNYT